MVIRFCLASTFIRNATVMKSRLESYNFVVLRYSLLNKCYTICIIMEYFIYLLNKLYHLYNKIQINEQLIF
jgi:hypothetical protein